MKEGVSKYTLDFCKVSAKKYFSRTEWANNEKSVYQTARVNGWLELCCSHMPKSAREPSKYTLERCQESAKKYLFRSEWKASEGGAYQAASQNGWLELCCSHMAKKNKGVAPRNWTLEACCESAKKYRSRTEWSAKEVGAYNAANQNGWLELCCSHMGKKVQWTLEACQESAKKYRSRTKWKAKEGGAYNAATRNGWLELCSSHMPSGKIALKYTLEVCQKSAKKYLFSTEWQASEGGAYQAAVRKGWLDICCAHMSKKRKVHKWTLETCKKNAEKYQSRSEWIAKDGGAYQAAVRKGWLDICCAHMSKKIRSHKWTLEACLADAKKYTSRYEWDRANGSAYKAALKNGWLELCCGHMSKMRRPYKWTLEACLADAKKYTTRSQWDRAKGGAYKAAFKNGWLDICCAHMPERAIKPYRWTFEVCHAEAQKYATYEEWRKNCEGSFYAAKRNGWLNWCAYHMSNV